MGRRSFLFRLTVICPVGMGIRFCRDGLVRSVLCHCSHKQPMKNPPWRVGGLRGRLWPDLCTRWRLSTALFRWMPDRFPFSVPGGLFVRRPSFPFRFRPSFPGLPFRIVISLVFSQPVGAPSFPCLPGFHLIYMRCFHVWLLVRLPCFPCVRLLSSSIHLSLPPVPPPFLRPLPFPFIFPLCTAPDTCPIFSLRAFRPGTSSSLSSFLPFFLRPWAFRSPYACFQPRCPTFPVLSPLFFRHLFLLFLLHFGVILPLFSALFLSFVFHLEKSSPLNRG